MNHELHVADSALSIGWSSERCLEKAQLLGRSGFTRDDIQSFVMQITEDSKDRLSFVMVKDYSLKLNT